jgi:putative acetyltransferase
MHGGKSLPTRLNIEVSSRAIVATALFVNGSLQTNSRVTIVTKVGTVDGLSLAPMAVLPSHQRQGIGSRLVEVGRQVCQERGHRIVVVLGHPEFYPRFGSSAELARRLESPFGGGEAWMALELLPRSLAGVEGRVEYPPPFKALD